MIYLIFLFSAFYAFCLWKVERLTFKSFWQNLLHSTHDPLEK
jgi:hypothetical protein